MLLGRNLRIGVLWIAEKCNGQPTCNACWLEFLVEIGVSWGNAGSCDRWMGNKRWLWKRNVSQCH
jgi:hypothetical protein